MLDLTIKWLMRTYTRTWAVLVKRMDGLKRYFEKAIDETFLWLTCYGG